jgi:hypothetical protein
MSASRPIADCANWMTNYLLGSMQTYSSAYPSIQFPSLHPVVPETTTATQQEVLCAQQIAPHA